MPASGCRLGVRLVGAWCPLARRWLLDASLHIRRGCGDLPPSGRSHLEDATRRGGSRFQSVGKVEEMLLSPVWQTW